jgi:hypothetical protein
MHLPPSISFKLMEVLGCPLSPNQSAHQWISEALYVKYPGLYGRSEITLLLTEWKLKYFSSKNGHAVSGCGAHHIVVGVF